MCSLHVLLNYPQYGLVYAIAVMQAHLEEAYLVLHGHSDPFLIRDMLVDELVVEHLVTKVALMTGFFGLGLFF